MIWSSIFNVAAATAAQGAYGSAHHVDQARYQWYQQQAMAAAQQAAQGWAAAQADEIQLQQLLQRLWDHGGEVPRTPSHLQALQIALRRGHVRELRDTDPTGDVRATYALTCTGRRRVRP